MNVTTIPHDETHLHGEFIERVPRAVFDAVNHWVKTNKQTVSDLEKDSEHNYSECLRKWRAGATLGADGVLSRKVYLQPSGKPRASDMEKHGHVGRAYFKDGISLSNMPRDLRGALSQGQYVDLDFSRCHPKALCGYAYECNVDPEHLADYVVNCTEYEQQWADDYNVSIDAAKRLVNIVLNCGTFDTWCKVNNLGNKFKQPELITNIEKERNEIYKLIKDDPVIKRVFKTKWAKWKRSDSSQPAPTLQKVALNSIMENIERRVLENVFEMFDDDERKYIRYEWDGIALPIDMYEKHRDYLESIGTPASPIDDYKMSIKVKDFDKSLYQLISFPDDDSTSQETDDMIEFDTETYDEADAVDLPTYEERKKHFEYFHCHIKNQGVIRKVYMGCGLDGHIERITEDFKITDMASQMMAVTKHDSSDKPFFKEWMKDAHRAWYDKCAWIPFDGVYSPDQHKALPGRTYNEFPGYNPAIVNGEITQQDRDNFNQWVDVAIEALGGKENFKVFTQLIAHKVKNPLANIEYTVVWRSQQGEGKTLTLSAIEKLIGNDMMLRLQQMDGFKSLGGTGRLKNKLLVEVNECESSQMKGLQGWLKSAATDPYIEVRELYKNPARAKSCSLWIICSNKLYAVSVDTDSGERRYFVFCGTGKYAACSNTGLPKRIWGKLHRGISSPGFIRLFYEFLTMKYDEDFDFRAAKQANAQTPAYQLMMGAQRRDELFFLQDWLESSGHVQAMEELNKSLKSKDKHHANPDDISVYQHDGPVFHELPSWNKQVNVGLKCMYQQFKNWSISNGQKSQYRSIKDFKNNVTHVLSLGLKCQPLTMSSDDIITFEPVRLYYTMFTSYMMTPADAVVDQLQTWREAEREALEQTQPTLTSADDTESDCDDYDDDIDSLMVEASGDDCV